MASLTRDEYKRSIEETREHYIVNRNPALDPLDSMVLKKIIVEFGRAPDESVKIRRLFYPKADYKKQDIFHLYKILKDCPHCYVGGRSSGIDTRSQNTFKEISSPKGDRSEPSMVSSITSVFDPVTKSPKMSNVYGSELIANALEIPIDMVMGALGGKIAKFLLGAAMSMGAKSRKATGRMADDLHEIGSHMLFRFLDPTPGQIAELKADFAKIRDALSFGNPVGALKALFRPTAVSFMAAKPGLREAVAGLSPTPMPAGLAQITGQMPLPVPVDFPKQLGGLGANVRTVLY